MSKLIQVNEDFWCSTDEIRSVEISRGREDDVIFRKDYASVQMKPFGREPNGAGFGKSLGSMWGSTADERAKNLCTEANRPYDFGLASERT